MKTAQKLIIISLLFGMALSLYGLNEYRYRSKVLCQVLAIESKVLDETDNHIELLNKWCYFVKFSKKNINYFSYLIVLSNVRLPR